MRKKQKISITIIVLAVLVAASLFGIFWQLIRGRQENSKESAMVSGNKISDVSQSDGQTENNSSPQEKNETALSLYKLHSQENEAFNFQKILPGDSKTGYYRVRVNYKDKITVRFKALPQQDKKLAKSLHIKVVLTDSSRELFDGKIKDLADGVCVTLKSNGFSQEDINYAVTAFLPTETNNEYADIDLSADFIWLADDKDNLGFSPETGKRAFIALLALIIVISGYSIIKLANKRGRENAAE